MEAKPGVVEAKPGVVEAKPGVVEAKPGVVEARIDAEQGEKGAAVVVVVEPTVVEVSRWEPHGE